MIVTGALRVGASFAVRSGDAVTLPNGMEARRRFDGSRLGRWDLYSVDGRQRLVRGIDFLCFNDRFVDVVPLVQGEGGVFDSEIDGKMEGLTRREKMQISGLRNRRGCGGYYSAMVGPGVLQRHIRGSRPFSCEIRNPEGPLRRNREWLDKPCADRPFP
ncbi:MAG: hypothetical protein AAGI51_14675 [Pseudomonadota bacterium]